MAEFVEEITIKLKEGYDVKAYVAGTGGRILLCANGGPGLSCEYLRTPHLRMIEKGFKLVFWDQLGCGSSDHPEDPALWTIERYVQEAEQVRQGLGLGKVNLLGHSWGVWLAVEYALAFPENLKSLILANGECNIPHFLEELQKHRHALGAETVRMMQHHEALGTLDHPEYQAAVTLLDYRHVCRLSEWPQSLKNSFKTWNKGLFETMQGPNEFYYTGNMKEWSREDDLNRITVPVLAIGGLYDLTSPACISRTVNGLPDAKAVLLRDSSHMPFYEEPDSYFHHLYEFLQ